MIDVDRRPDAPPSLASQKSFCDDDVIEALNIDFHGKCYLCERRHNVAYMEVDHRVPKAKVLALKFEWTNLFPACSPCNGQRTRGTPTDGYLSPGQGVEQRLTQTATPSNDVNVELSCDFSAVSATDAPAIATATELQRLHTVDTRARARKRMKGAELLREIASHYTKEIATLEVSVLRARRDKQSAGEAEGLLRARLSRKARFSMLLRSLVAPSLADLFD
ncbi:MAG: HNH endonuclease [Nannocystaceae bacterium]|nr:HNH endonuclease [Nannocystaceae bacterium]